MKADCNSYGFVYASGYTPLPDRKSFIPDSHRQHFDEFTQLNGFKPGIRIDENGSKWPDFLLNGGGYVAQFVSERVIAALIDAGVEILDTTEFPIESIDSGGSASRANLSEAPRYYVLEAPPEIIPDWERMNVRTEHDGAPILDPLPKPWPPSPFIYKKETWSGRDLVSPNWKTMVKCTTKLIVSDRVRRMAEEQKWTNVSFDGIGFTKVQW